MAKYYTKEQVVLKFKYDLLPSLKKEFGDDDHENFELAWVCFLEQLYNLKKISINQVKIWKYPKHLLTS